MYIATYERSSQIIWSALLHNVYHRLVCYFAYENSMAEEEEFLFVFALTKG